MSSSGGYRVDLEALDVVRANIDRVIQDMDTAKGKSKAAAHVPPGALGTGFAEEEQFRSAHDQVKCYIEDEILERVERLIVGLAQKTARTRELYAQSDREVQEAMDFLRTGNVHN